ncbi:acid phosphatase [Bacteroidia bacterium]|nr:acid phosphatase [Bacteroidia bacterium]GHV04662.1 acid phosphatase [Bacteroidia bacterium]
MKRIIFSLLVIFGAVLSYAQENISITLPEVSESAVNFIVANDLGRNGYYEQKPIARIMGYAAENMSIEMVAAAGDIHHFGGIASVNDPLWMTNYELIYDHPELMIDWYAVCGNHEYRGNTQAVLDYSHVSRRWNAPEKYYTKVIQSEDGGTCRLVFIDTTPMMDKYRNDSLTYPDACKQDVAVQLHWIDSVLVHSTEKWKIVIGHHPVYAETKKEKEERADMQAHLAPILEKNKVDVYFCGHIHNFQHIRPNSSKVNYVVNSAGSLSRPVKAIEGTLFCSPDPGFTICSADNQTFKFFFINHKGKIIYDYTVRKNHK